MKNIVIIVLMSALISSCAKSKMINLPNGNKGYSITCNGTAVAISKCMEKAGEVCPNGYNEITSHNNRGIMTGFNNEQIATSQKGMLIECK